jgi:hypothetical protein
VTVVWSDNQVCGETESTLLTVKGVTQFAITLKNSGVNTMNYRLQNYSGSAWVDLGESGSDYYNTLSANQVRQIMVSATYPQVQIVGNASGGAFLEFSAMTEVNRPDGGSFTILPI